MYATHFMKWATYFTYCFQSQFCFQAALLAEDLKVTVVTVKEAIAMRDPLAMVVSLAHFFLGDSMGKSTK